MLESVDLTVNSCIHSHPEARILKLHLDIELTHSDMLRLTHQEDNSIVPETMEGRIHNKSGNLCSLSSKRSPGCVVTHTFSCHAGNDLELQIVTSFQIVVNWQFTIIYQSSIPSTTIHSNSKTLIYVLLH